MKKSLKEILSQMDTSEKIKYIWHYYRLHILGVLAIIIILSVSVNSIMNKKETIMNVMVVGEMVDTTRLDEIKETLNEELIDEGERNSAEIMVQFVNYSPTNGNPQAQMGIQKVVAELAAAAIDVMIIDKDFFDQLNTDDQLLSIQEVSGIEGLPFEEEQVYYSPGNESEIVGIDVKSIKFFDEAFFDESVVLCIPGNTKKVNDITRFLQLIIQ